MQRAHWAIWLPLCAVSALVLAVRHHTSDLAAASSAQRAEALASSSARASETSQTGADRRPLPAADDAPKKREVFSRFDQPGPGYRALDPKSFGYASLAQMEREVRLRLHIPDDAHVTLFSQERNGKAGVAIEVVPRQAQAR